MIQAKETRAPVTNHNGVTFVHIKENNVHVVAVTKHNANATLVLEYMYQLVLLFRQYFDGNFDEDTLKANFPLVYEVRPGAPSPRPRSPSRLSAAPLHSR